MTSLFQILSDIHLETRVYIGIDEFIKPSCDYLILCGDIGNPLNENLVYFLSDIRQHYKLIFFVLGNHEYYNSLNLCIFEMKGLMMGIIDRYENIKLLDNSTYTIEDLNIQLIGSTLWSFCPNLETAQILINGMNDYRYIFDDEKKNITPYYTNRKFKECVIFIEHEVLKAKKKKQICIIITHYLPSFKAIDERYKSSALNSAFASNLDDIICAENMKYWICGHTHCPVNLTIDGCQIVTNPFGYLNENTMIQKNKFISI